MTAACSACGDTTVPLTDEGAASRCWAGCRSRRASDRTRRELRRANAMQHRDLLRLAQENQRLRRALDLCADEVENTAARFFLVVTKGGLRAMAERIRALRWSALR